MKKDTRMSLIAVPAVAILILQSTTTTTVTALNVSPIADIVPKARTAAFSTASSASSSSALFSSYPPRQDGFDLLNSPISVDQRSGFRSIENRNRWSNDPFERTRNYENYNDGGRSVLGGRRRGRTGSFRGRGGFPNNDPFPRGENGETVRTTEDAVNRGWRRNGRRNRRMNPTEYYRTDARFQSKNNKAWDSSRGEWWWEDRSMETNRNPFEDSDLASMTIQGDNCLRTWSLPNPLIQRAQVLLKTDGRPLNANVDLWHGPDNSPQRLRVYSDDGALRPLNAVFETPGYHNAIALRNIGPIEFPMYAAVDVDMASNTRDYSVSGMYGNAARQQDRWGGRGDGYYNNGYGGYGSGYGHGPYESYRSNGYGDYYTESYADRYMVDGATARFIQGGAVFTTPFDPSICSVQVLLKTTGRPLNARVELLQGPNNVKQVLDIYSEDGKMRPFYAVMETPGVGNVIRIVNQGPMEFPLTASLEPYLIDSSRQVYDNYYGADRRW